MKSACTLLILLALAGCATLENTPSAVRTRILDAPYDVVYQAVVQKVVESGYAADSSKTDRGAYIRGTKSPEYVARSYPLIKERDIFLEARLTPVGSEQTEVRLAFMIEDAYHVLGPVSVTMPSSQAADIYEHALNRIEERVHELHAP